LTRGVPRLANSADIAAADLAAAASLAAVSRHPLSRALVAAAGSAVAADGVEERPGQGLRARVDGQELRLGSADWCGVPAPTVEDEKSPTAAFWFRRGDAPGVCFRFNDDLRPDAASTLAFFRQRGLPLELLSGDREAVVAAVADRLKIERFAAAQRPTQKIARLEALRRQGHRVLMVGDGLNDAPALAAAHVSISPSSAADISQTAADFVFQGESLAPLSESYRVARKARRLILQNFGLAAAYNLVSLPLAVAGFVTPLGAALAMSSSSLVVTLNALRLRQVDRSRQKSQDKEATAWKPSFT
jgi:Cu2+-exporting ATPase